MNESPLATSAPDTPALDVPRLAEDRTRHTGGRPRVVIVGGGFGGLRAAKALRHAPVDLTVIDRNNHHVFQPLLYWVATAGLSPADISYPIRGILRRQRNAEVQMGEVTEIDVAGQRVLVGDRAVPYDYLILATGARHSYFGHADWEEFAPGLKSLADATLLRRNILTAFERAELECDPARRAALLTFVIVGAGPTGVEMAGAIAELAHKALRRDFRHFDPASARVLLVEAGPRILPTFSPHLSARAQRGLEHLGVEVVTGKAVNAVDAEHVLIGDERVEARNTIWAAGVAASPVGQWLGVPTDRAGRVPVNPDLTIAGHPEIFVIGDTAVVPDGEHTLPGVAQVAMQSGYYVARLIKRRVAGDTNAAESFSYFDKGNLATVGRSFAVAQIWHLELSGYLAWLVWTCVHILYLIGYRNRFVVMFQWAWTYLTYQRGARLIIPGTTSDE